MSSDNDVQSQIVEYQSVSELFGVGFSTLFSVAKTYLLMQGVLFAIYGAIALNVRETELLLGKNMVAVAISSICCVGLISSIGSIHIIGKFIAYLRVCIDVGIATENSFEGAFYKKVDGIWSASDPKVFNCSSVFKYVAYLFVLIWLSVLLASVVDVRALV